MKKIFIMTLISLSTFAASCPKERSLNEIVKDMITLDLSGIRVDGMEKSSCLDAKKHPYANLTHDASNELPSNPNYFADDISNIKIVSVTLKDPEVYTYEAVVEMDVKSLNNKKVTLKDKYLFFLNKDEEVQKNSGCFSVLQYPENIILFKNCLK